MPLEKESDVGEQGVRLPTWWRRCRRRQQDTHLHPRRVRNDPFSALNEVAGKGLAIVDAPSGSIVAYSTAPGAEASDGRCVLALCRRLYANDLDAEFPIEQFFKKFACSWTTRPTLARRRRKHLATSDFVFSTNANADAAASAPPAKVAIVDLRTRSPGDAYEVVVAEDSVEYYEEFVRLYPTDPRCDHIRRALSRRLQMVESHKATKGNSAADYAAFLSKHGNGEFAKAAKKLQERPRLVALPSPLKSGGNLGQVSRRSRSVAGRSAPAAARPPVQARTRGSIVSKPGGAPIVSKPGGNVITPITTTTVNSGRLRCGQTDS